MTQSTAIALTENEKKQLALIEQEELQLTRDGIDLKPVRYKLNKDTCQFIDPFGQSHEELRGVIVFKQKVRGHWQEGNKTPLCRSIGCVIGTDQADGKHNCASCPQNEWGSGKNGVGKACKEKRRVFFVPPGSMCAATIDFSSASINDFDTFESARLQQRIPDIAAEFVARGVPAKSDQGFTYAQAQFKLGKKITDLGEMLEYRRIRELIQVAAAKMDVEDDEYEKSDAPQAEKAAEGDVF